MSYRDVHAALETKGNTVVGLRAGHTASITSTFHWDTAGTRTKGPWGYALKKNYIGKKEPPLGTFLEEDSPVAYSLYLKANAHWDFSIVYLLALSTYCARNFRVCFVVQVRVHEDERYYLKKSAILGFPSPKYKSGETLPLHKKISYNQQHRCKSSPLP